MNSSPGADDGVKQRLRVTLLVETSTTWGAGIVRSVVRFARERGGWLLDVEPAGRDERRLLSEGHRPDGVIARVNHQGLATQILGLGVPAVNVSWFDWGPDIASVTSDEVGIGKMAVAHLIGLGWRAFAYCGPAGREGYVDRMGEAFVNAVTERGWPCAVFHRGPARVREHDWRQLAGWIASLPDRTAMFVWDDRVGRLVAEVCLGLGFQVPARLSILSGGYDELMNSAAYPSLTSVHHAPEGVGYRAAATLHRILSGDVLESRQVVVSGAHIVIGQSTDSAATGDELLGAALAFMRSQATRGADVADVLREVPVSRRWLEQRCRELLGRSPAEELRRLRIERAKSLLATSQLPVGSIAQRSGFKNVDAFSRRFRLEVGESPSEFRRLVRSGGAA